MSATRPGTPVADGLPALGTQAPALRLSDQHGEVVDLADLRGERSALVVFFPFAFSGICTGELADLREDQVSLAAAGVQLVAVSCDPVFSLRAWAEQEGYTFPLLSDFWPHGDVARSFGVFADGAGRAERASFLLDPDGVVRWHMLNHPGEARDPAAYREAVADLTR